LLNLLQTEPKFVGLNQSTRAVRDGVVRAAYVARDADSHVVFPFERLCRENGVEIVYVDTMKELAELCEVEVNTAVAVVVNR